MEWILTKGNVEILVNAYLPVVLFLSLIMVLPYIFEWIAVSCEGRKTNSDITRSMIDRYFYYQVSNLKLRFQGSFSFPAISKHYFNSACKYFHHSECRVSTITLDVEENYQFMSSHSRPDTCVDLILLNIYYTC